MAPPRVVDYQPETDELALLQTLEGAVEEEGQEEAPEEDDDEEGGAVAARRKQVSGAGARRKDSLADGASRRTPVLPWAGWEAPLQRAYLPVLPAARPHGRRPYRIIPAAAAWSRCHRPVPAATSPTQEAARKTRKDRNRELRRREVEEALAEQVRLARPRWPRQLHLRMHACLHLRQHQVHLRLPAPESRQPALSNLTSDLTAPRSSRCTLPAQCMPAAQRRKLQQGAAPM